MNSSSSGETAARALPSTSSWLLRSSVSAERLTSSTSLRPSSATTPAVTLDRTASMNARRISSWRLAFLSSPVCSSSLPAMRLNAAESVCTSSSVSATGTRAEKSPSSIRPAAPTSWPTGRTRRSARLRAVKMASPTMISAPSRSAALNRSWLLRERSSKV